MNHSSVNCITNLHPLLRFWYSDTCAKQRC